MWRYVTFARFCETIMTLGGFMQEYQELMTPGEVARLFGVDPKTVSRWANAGKISYRITPGGHRRFQASEIKAMLSAQQIGNSN
jgi:excisionase family DNA binding protein